MSALGTHHNRFLRQYGATLAPGSREAQAFEKATAIANQNARRELMTAPHATLAGGDAWNSFDQFHAVRKAMEGLLGNKYGVGAISGGGDINVRDASGGRPSEQLNGPAGLRALPGSAGTDVYTGRSLDAPRVGTGPRASTARTGGDMDESDLFAGGWGRAGTPRGVLQDLALRKLHAQLAPMEADADDAQMFPTGSQSAVDLELGAMGRKRQAALQQDEALAGQKANQWWRYTLPQEEYTRGEAERTAERAHGRNIDLARVKGEAATMDDVIRAMASGERTSATERAAAMRALQARAGNLTQYGEDPSVYDAELQRMLSGVPAGPGRAGGAGAGTGAPSPAAARDGQRGRGPNGESLVYLARGPEGPGWYEE